MRVAERRPIDHSLNATHLDKRALGWGIDVGPGGEIRQGPEPRVAADEDESAPYPWSREVRVPPPDGL